MDIRLIALDLDGTLLTSRKTVSEKNKKALKEAADRGIQVVLATGRTINSIQAVIQELPFIRYAVLENGALVQDLSTGEIIRNVPLPKGKMTELLRLSKEKGFYCDCFIDGEGVSARGLKGFLKEVPLDEYTRDLITKSRREVDNFPELVAEHEGRIDKANLMFRTKEQRQEIAELIGRDREVIGTNSLGVNVEVNHKDAIKGRGVQALADFLHIPMDTVMAFGDSDNDLSMIEMAGAGIAMGNAGDDIKAAARYITKPNDEDGVAAMVERIWRE